MVDIKASSQLEDNVGVPFAAYLYTVSTMHCMSVSLGLDGAGLGTCWGRSWPRRCSPTPASAMCRSTRSSRTRSTSTTSRGRRRRAGQRSRPAMTIESSRRQSLPQLNGTGLFVTDGGLDVQTGVPRFWTGSLVGFVVARSSSTTACRCRGSPCWPASVGMLLALLTGMPAMVRTRFCDADDRPGVDDRRGGAAPSPPSTPRAPSRCGARRGGPARTGPRRCRPATPIGSPAIEGLVLEVEPLTGRRPRLPRASRGGEPRRTAPASGLPPRVLAKVHP